MQAWHVRGDRRAASLAGRAPGARPARARGDRALDRDAATSPSDRVAWGFHGDFRRLNEHFRDFVLAGRSRSVRTRGRLAAERLRYDPDVALRAEPDPWVNRVFVLVDRRPQAVRTCRRISLPEALLRELLRVRHRGGAQRLRRGGIADEVERRGDELVDRVPQPPVAAVGDDLELAAERGRHGHAAPRHRLDRRDAEVLQALRSLLARARRVPEQRGLRVEPASASGSALGWKSTGRPAACSRSPARYACEPAIVVAPADQVEPPVPRPAGAAARRRR